MSLFNVTPWRAFILRSLNLLHVLCVFELDTWQPYAMAELRALIGAGKKAGSDPNSWSGISLLWSGTVLHKKKPAPGAAAEPLALAQILNKYIF